MKSTELLENFKSAQQTLEKINNANEHKRRILLCNFANVFHSNLKLLKKEALVKQPKKIKTLWKTIMVIYNNMENFIEEVELDIDISYFMRCIVSSVIDLFCIIQDYCTATKGFEIAEKLSFLEAYFSDLSLDILLNCRSFTHKKDGKLELYIPAIRKICALYSRKVNSVNVFLKVLLIYKVIVASQLQKENPEIKVLSKTFKRNLIIPPNFCTWIGDQLGLTLTADSTVKNIIKQINSPKAFKILYPNETLAEKKTEMKEKKGTCKKSDKEAKKEKTSSLNLASESDGADVMNGNMLSPKLLFKEYREVTKAPNNISAMGNHYEEDRSLFKENIKLNARNISTENYLLESSPWKQIPIASKPYISTKINDDDDVGWICKPLKPRISQKIKSKTVSTQTEPEMNSKTNRKDLSTSSRVVQYKDAAQQTISDTLSVHSDIINDGESDSCRNSKKKKMRKANIEFEEHSKNTENDHVKNDKSVIQESDNVENSESKFSPKLPGNSVDFQNNTETCSISDTTLNVSEKNNALPSQRIRKYSSSTDDEQSGVNDKGKIKVLKKKRKKKAKNDTTENSVSHLEINSKSATSSFANNDDKNIVNIDEQTNNFEPINDDVSFIENVPREISNGSLDAADVSHPVNYNMKEENGVNAVSSHDEVEVLSDYTSPKDKKLESALSLSEPLIDEASGNESDIIPCDEDNDMFGKEEMEEYHNQLRTRVSEQRREKVTKLMQELSDKVIELTNDEEEKKEAEYRPVEDSCRIIDSLYLKRKETEQLNPPTEEHCVDNNHDTCETEYSPMEEGCGSVESHNTEIPDTNSSSNSKLKPDHTEDYEDQYKNRNRYIRKRKDYNSSTSADCDSKMNDNSISNIPVSVTFNENEVIEHGTEDNCLKNSNTAETNKGNIINGTSDIKSKQFQEPENNSDNSCESNKENCLNGYLEETALSDSYNTAKSSLPTPSYLSNNYSFTAILKNDCPEVKSPITDEMKTEAVEVLKSCSPNDSADISNNTCITTDNLDAFNKSDYTNETVNEDVSVSCANTLVNSLEVSRENTLQVIDCSSDHQSDDITVTEEPNTNDNMDNSKGIDLDNSKLSQTEENENCKQTTSALDSSAGAKASTINLSLDNTEYEKESDESKRNEESVDDLNDSDVLDSLTIDFSEIDDQSNNGNQIEENKELGSNLENAEECPSNLTDTDHHDSISPSQSGCNKPNVDVISGDISLPYKKVLNFDSEIEIGRVSPILPFTFADLSDDENNSNDNLVKEANDSSNKKYSTKLTTQTRSPSNKKYDFIYKSPRKSDGTRTRRSKSITKEIEALTPLKVANAALDSEVTISPSVSDEDNVSSDCKNKTDTDCIPVPDLHEGKNMLNTGNEEEEQINADQEFPNDDPASKINNVNSDIKYTSDISHESDIALPSNSKPITGRSNSANTTPIKRRTSESFVDKKCFAELSTASPLKRSKRLMTKTVKEDNEKLIIEENTELSQILEKNKSEEKPRDQISSSRPDVNLKTFDALVLDSPKRRRSRVMADIEDKTPEVRAASTLQSPARRERRRSSGNINLTPVRRSSRLKAISEV